MTRSKETFHAWSGRRQREAVIVRSRGQCEFERKYTAHASVDNFGVQHGPSEYWERCSNRPPASAHPTFAGQAAHIFRRWKHTLKTKYAPECALWACQECHRRFDSYRDDVRVPLALIQAAYDLIFGDADNAQHQRELRASLGPRPEKGEGAYCG